MRQRVKKAGTALIMIFAMLITMFSMPTTKVQAAEKNASDVAALKAIIKTQEAAGYKWENVDLDNSDIYTWKDGRLVGIYWKGCYIGSISFSGLPMLESLTIISPHRYEYDNIDDIKDNFLHQLDLSKNTKLKYLDCSFNELTQLDLSNNKELLELKCEECYLLEKINIRNCTKLTELNLAACRSLKKLDVSKNTKLTELSCDSTQIKKLDVSKNVNLTSLGCSDTQIKKLDVSKNTKLTGLYCGHTQIKKLDVSKNTKLTELYCDHTQIKKLNLKKCKKLEMLWVNDGAEVTGYSGNIHKW